MKDTRFVEAKGMVDFRPLLPLIRSEWPDGFGKQPDRKLLAMMDENYRPESDIIHYLYLENRLAGFSRYTAWPRTDGPREADPFQPDIATRRDAHTLDIAVAEKYRRRGFGMDLLQHMVDDSRRRRFHRLLSRSLRNNPASIALHEKAGFSVHLETDDSIVWFITL